MVTRVPKNEPIVILQKVRHFCGFQERCIRDVEEKLKEWAVQDKMIPSIIHQLQQENFLNEERFAKVFAGGKFRINKWGRKKIEFELYHRGIQELFIQQGLLEIDNDEYLKTLREIIEKKRDEIKPGKENNIRQKIINFAIGKGFETDLILAILKELKI